MVMRRLSPDAFTLMELLVVVIIIGVLVSVSVPSYINTREKAVDKEAISTLTLIRAANKQYFSRCDAYYPYTGSTGNLNYINSNLSIYLVGGNWAYTLSGNGATFTATATRGSRTWTITDATAFPTCSGSGCLP